MNAMDLCMEVNKKDWRKDKNSFYELSRGIDKSPPKLT
jgi:hypothetical protein